MTDRYLRYPFTCVENLQYHIRSCQLSLVVHVLSSRIFSTRPAMGEGRLDQHSHNSIQSVDVDVLHLQGYLAITYNVACKNV